MARGSIIKQKSGKYAIMYRAPDETGKIRQVSKVVGTNKKEAEAVLTQIMGTVDSGTYTPPKAILFRDLADKFLKKSKAAIKETTYISYEGHIRNYLKPRFGHLAVRSISAESVDLFISDLAAMRKDNGEPKISATTIGNIFTTLKAILLTGVNWQYLSKSPADTVKKPRKAYKELDFYKPDEIARLLETADEKHYALLLTAALTGARRSEVLGLAWSDIQWSDNIIHIRHQAQGGKLVELKSAHSRRRIPMSPRLVRALQEHQLRQTVDGPANPLNLVFTSEAGTVIDGANLLRRIYWPIAARAGLRRLPFHSLRHSAATIRLSRGVPLPEVSMCLGHRDVSITAKVYAHHLPRTQIATDELESAIFGASDKERIPARVR